MNTVRVRIPKDIFDYHGEGQVKMFSAGDVVGATLDEATVRSDNDDIDCFRLYEGQFEVIAEADAEWRAIVDAMGRGDIGIIGDSVWRYWIKGEYERHPTEYPTPSAAARAAWNVLCERREEGE